MSEIKKCPNEKCQKFIEKNGGCRWIKCICKKKWCWNCNKLKKNKSKNDTFENNNNYCKCN